jgi:hypothetical protein
MGAQSEPAREGYQRTRFGTAQATPRMRRRVKSTGEEWARVVAGSWDLKISTPCETRRVTVLPTGTVHWVHHLSEKEKRMIVGTAFVNWTWVEVRQVPIPFSSEMSPKT